MATTTMTAVRDRIITVIEELVPVSVTDDPFRAFRNELDAKFRSWAQGNATSCARRFQVRDKAIDPPPALTNHDVEEKFATFEIVVAYPQVHRWGTDALARDRVMAEDQQLIKEAIGVTGAANFAAPYPDACWRDEDTPEREEGDGVDFLVIRQTMSFYRARSS